MTRPVSVGQPLFPEFTAEWYNSTLEKPRPSNPPVSLPIPKAEGRIYCRCLDTDNDADRFKPVGIYGWGSDDINIRPIIEVDYANVDEHNWIIPQEKPLTDRMIECVVFGLTKAWVTTRETDDTHVVYDGTELVTAKEGKAQILVKGDDQFPSLINIGNQVNCVRVMGYLSEALSGANDQVFTMTDLKGINFSATELGTDITPINLHGWEADNAAVARAEWIHDLNIWALYQVDCPGTTPYDLNA